MKHKPNCLSNITCLVYHGEGGCPGYRECDCDFAPKKEEKNTLPTPTQKPKECCPDCMWTEVDIDKSMPICNDNSCGCHQVASGEKKCDHSISKAAGLSRCDTCGEPTTTPEPVSEEGDYLDRFSEVVKGLGLSKEITNKIANFIHYEMRMAHSRTAEAAQREEREIVRKEEREECNHNHKPDWNKLEKLAKECSDPIEDWVGELEKFYFVEYEDSEAFVKDLHTFISKYRTLWQAEARREEREEIMKKMQESAKAIKRSVQSAKQ